MGSNRTTVHCAEAELNSGTLLPGFPEWVWHFQQPRRTIIITAPKAKTSADPCRSSFCAGPSNKAFRPASRPLQATYPNKRRRDKQQGTASAARKGLLIAGTGTSASAGTRKDRENSTGHKSFAELQQQPAAAAGEETHSPIPIMAMSRLMTQERHTSTPQILSSLIFSSLWMRS